MCVFINNKSRFMDENIEVQEENQEEENRIMLDEEVTQEIASKEVIKATDTSVKENNMVGVWRIENFYECASAYNIIWCRKCEK